MTHQEIAITVHDGFIHGDLELVPNSKKLVIFAHGSGSSRFSVRNKFVADLFHRAGISTLLFDLLTEKEEAKDQFTREFRFDIELLAKRLVMATEWIQDNQETASFSVGYFGASTGAAAALIAASRIPQAIKAVVSRGGRPDLAENYFPQVKCPTLLIVGGLDDEVIKLNQHAYNYLSCTKELVIIPGATHLFEEGNTLEQAAESAQIWFTTYL